nr:hypothetical protein [Tanacetum cinerariifolium]
MEPKKRTTRESPAITTTTTPVTNAHLKALIDQGVADALAACDVDRSINGDDSHNSGTDKYCPSGEIKKLETEIWNLKVKGTDVDAIEFATKLIDKKISTLAERQTEDKRKFDNNNQAQQQLPKRQNVAQAYAIGTGEGKEYNTIF